MAIFKTLIATLFLSLFVLHLVQAKQTNSNLVDNNSDSVTSYPKDKIDCGGACETRCMLSSRPRLCKRACGTCCGRCNCVPSGTSGNLDSCPCYANMTTRNNKRKCP